MFFSVRSCVTSQKHCAALRKKSIDPQSGNIFFTLFGAVVVVGLLGTVITSTMRGPLTTMVEVQARTQAESEMAIASRLSLLEATELADSGDCDGDGFVEPLEYTPGAGPTGGGFLPNEVASARIDPWGTEYGYCAWDAGSVTNDAACEIDGNAGNQRLLGNGSPTDETYTVVAIVSAGPDQVFETSCNGGASPSITKNGDDIVVEYTYATATASTGGLWNLKPSQPDVAEITKDIEVTGQASFSNGINLTGSPTAALRLGAASMLLPDETTLTTCNGANDGLVRINTATNPNTMELCDSGTGWVAAAGVWTSGVGNDIFYNSPTPQVGIGTATPNNTLDVVGTFDLSGAATLGDTLDVTGATSLAALGATGAVDFDSTLNVDGASTLADTTVSTLNATGAVDFDSTLNVDGASTLADTTVSTLNATGAVDFDSTLNVDGTSTLVGAIDAQGAIANSTGDVTLSDDVEITGTLDAQGAVSNSTGNLTLSDDVDISNNLDVTGNIDGTDITASSDLAAGSTISVNGDQLGPALNCSSAQKLEWNNGSGWSCVTDLQGGSGGGVPALDDITDVSAASPSDGDCLTYNNTSGDWENGSCTGTTAGVFEVVSNVIRVKATAGDYTNDDFVFGSPQLDDDGDANHYNRLFFDKSKGAFRVGSAAGTQWNVGNVGDYSFVSGRDSTATAIYSIAMGQGVDVTGQNSIAIGRETTVTGMWSMGLGLGNPSGADSLVSGDSSFGIFLGDTTSYDVAADNTVALVGGTMAIGDVVATTGGEQDLEFDVTGDIGAANYCDEDGNDCFTASAVSGGIWTDLGGDRIHYGDTGAEQVGVGTNNPQVTLDVNGSVRVGSVTGAAAPRFMNLNDLGDVSASAPTTGDCITYNNVTGEWEAGTCVVSGDSITLPINADNATSPAGQVISIDAGANNFLSFAGADNIFLGRQAGNAITTGDQNTFVGSSSGDVVEDGRRNTALGYASLSDNISGNLNTAVGYGALRATTGSGNTAIGFGAMENNITGESNLAAGSNSLYYNETGELNVALGQFALNNNVDGDRNVAVGPYAAGEGTSISNVTALGYAAGRDSTANDNTFIGYESGRASSGSPLTGTDNTFVGYQTGQVNTSGFANTFVGDRSGAANIGGDENTFVGSKAGDDHTTGVENIYIGSNTGGLNGNYNVAIGEKAGQLLQGNASLNVFVGDDAGYLNTTGDDNTFIGGRAGILTTTGSRNIVIGRGATNLTATTDDYLNIGNAIYGVMDTNGTSAVGDGEASIIIDGDLTVTGAVNATFSPTYPLDVEGETTIFEIATGNFPVFVNAPTNENLFIGRGAGASVTPDTPSADDGESNTFVGIDSGLTTTSGKWNVFVGSKAGYTNTTGLANTLIGMQSGSSNTSGLDNTFLGAFSGASNNSNSNVLIGHSAGGASTGPNNTFLGSYSGLITTSGEDNLFLGRNSGANNTTGSRNIILGSNTDNLTAATDNYLNIANTIFGDMGTNQASAGTGDASITIDGDLTVTGTISGATTSLPIDADTAPGNVLININAGTENFLAFPSTNNLFFGPRAGDSHTTGDWNTFVGHDAGSSNETGIDNSFFGSYAGEGNTGRENTYIGANTGRGVVAGNYNTFVGQDSGRIGTAGDYNTFLGQDAGSNNSGDNNTYIGQASAINSGAGANNTFVGKETGSDSAGSDNNVFLGYQSGRYATADNNTLVGYQSGMAASGSPLTGTDNTFVGFQSGFVNTSGFANTFIGDSAGNANTSGRDNTFIGYNSGLLNVSGIDNTFIGSESGSANLGNSNTFIGDSAGLSNTTGASNMFMGRDAGRLNTSGDENTVIGSQAGSISATLNSVTIFGFQAGQNVTGLRNTFVGYQTGQATTSGINNTFMGYQSGIVNTTGQANTFIGDRVGLANTTGDDNVFFGSYSGVANTIGDANTFLGTNSGASNVSGAQTVAIGSEAGSTSAALDAVTIIGFQAGQSTTGTDNTFVGYQAGRVNTSGADNTFIGDLAGSSNTAASSNTFIGSKAGRLNVSGTFNTYLGRSSGESNVSGVWNTYLGEGSGELSTSGSRSVIVGVDAGYNANTTESVLVGQNAGRNTTGALNTFIGFQAGDLTTTGTRNIIIGPNADAPAAATDNYLNIGNAITGTLDVAAPFDSSAITIAGDLTVTGTCTGCSANSVVFEVTGASGSEVVSSVDASAPYATADFVFGSPQLADDGDTDHDSRMLFDKSKAAFRAGRVTTTSWDDGNIGNNSIAIGEDLSASGDNALALAGPAASALGNSSIAIGNDIAAVTNNTIVIGYASNAFSGTNSITLGTNVTTTGSYSMALGLGSTAGTNPTVSGNNSLGIFMGDQDSVAVSAANTFSVMGGTMAIGDVAASTGGEQNLELDVTGDIGAVNYCDEDGDNCFTAASLAGGAAGALNDLSDVITSYGAVNNMFLGNTAGTSSTDGIQNISIGANSLGSLSGTCTASGACDDNIAIGTSAGRSATTGEDNTFIGSLSGFSLTTGESNLLLGSRSGFSISTGSNNIVMGTGAGSVITTGSANIVIGNGALSEGGNNTGIVAIGDDVAGGNGATTSVSESTMIGYRAAKNGTGDDLTVTSSTVIGYNAAGGGNSGDKTIVNSVLMGANIGNIGTGDTFSATDTVAIGNDVLESNAASQQGVIIGYQAGNVLDGNNNTFVGYRAGNSVTTGTGNLLFGHDVDAPSATTSNYLNIGDAITGDMTTGNITIAGTAALTVPTGTAAQRPTATDGMIRYKTDATIGFEVRESGAWVAMGASVSDKRLKRDIKPLNSENILDKLAQVGTYQYSMKNDSSQRTQYGVIAQELNDVFPELVDGSEDDADNMMSVRYNGFIAPLIEATKTLRAENIALKTQLSDVKTAQINTNAALADLTQQVALLNKVALQNTGKKASMEHYLMLLLGLIGGMGLILIIQRKTKND